jgi:hypothetical protein
MVKGIVDPVTKFTNDYVLYPDSDDSNTYYALAEFPRILADGQGDPSFNLTWYFGSNVTSGGICTLTVGLPIPDATDPAVRTRLLNAITGDSFSATIAEKTKQFCEASKKGEKDKAAALKKELGFTEEIANRKVAAFKPDEGASQFLPGANLKLAAVPFKSGSVVVQAFADEKNYKAGTVEYSTGKIATTPSLVNSNAAVVTFNLEEQGANLFWHGMGGPSFDGPKPKGYDAAAAGVSVISVVYKTEFDGLLPSAQATVTFKAEKIASLATKEVERKGWGRKYDDQIISKDYHETVNDATEITLPAWTSEKDRETVQKQLTEWAAKQLEEMLKSQMPEVKMTDLDPIKAKKISTLKEQTRTYKLSQAMAVLKNPQAQLAKIKGADQDKCFHLVNLNDKPFFEVDLTVAPPAGEFMKTRKVSRFVVTELAFGKKKLVRKSSGKEVGQLEYKIADNAIGSETLAGTFANTDPERVVGYSYLVGYTDGTKSFQSKPTSQTNQYQLDLAGTDLGVLAVTLNAIDLPWDVLSSARVDLTYGAWQTTEMIKKDDAPHVVVKPFGEPITKELKYKLTLNLTAGAPIVIPETVVPLENGEAVVRLPSPFGTSTYRVNFDIDSQVSKALLKVEYKMAVATGAARVFSETIRLDSANPKVIWTVPRSDTDNDTFEVVKGKVTDTDNANTDPKGDLAKVSASDTTLDVTVKPNEIEYF